MSKWIQFNGTSKDIGNGYFLMVAHDDGGAFKIDSIHVKNEDDISYVANGQVVTEMIPPKYEKHLDNDGANSMKSCEKWACIGFVKICCDDGSIHGGCIGVVGC